MGFAILRSLGKNSGFLFSLNYFENVLFSEFFKNKFRYRQRAGNLCN